MSSQAVDIYGDRIWKDFLSLAGFFSPAIAPLQKELSIASSELLHLLGEGFGRRAAQRFRSVELDAALNGLVEMWTRLGIGRFEIMSKSPLTIVIRNCTICGQIPEMGRLFKCAFHEAFLEGFLSERLGRRVVVRQESGYEGESGLWTRRYTTDVTVNVMSDTIT
jgi:predicted hydrocarbon binding protein